jgi:hypothetical protein
MLDSVVQIRTKSFTNAIHVPNLSAISFLFQKLLMEGKGKDRHRTGHEGPQGE